MGLGLPLRPTLVTLVTSLILIGVAGVGTSAYITSHRVVDTLWIDLSQRISHNTVLKTFRYLEPAVPYAAMLMQLVENGQLDPEDEMAMIGHFRAAIEANENFTWASYARVDGTYIAAYRNEQREILATWRSQETTLSSSPQWPPAVCNTST